MPAVAPTEVRAGSPRRAAERAPVSLLAAAWALTLLSVVPWRRDVLFDGGLDGVVLGKAAVAAVALVAAILVHRLWRRRPAAPVSIAPLILLAVVVAVSLAGAALSGDLRAAAVQAVRLVVLGATAAVLLRCAAPERTLRVLVGVLTGYGAVGAVTGAVAMAIGPARKRLEGGFPAFEPNELAAVLLPCELALIALLLTRRRRVPIVLALAAVLGTILWTGSRTSAALVVLGAVLLVVARRRAIRLQRRVVIGLIAAVVVVVAALAASGLLADAVLRGEGLHRLLTLNSRTFAWREVFATPPGSTAWWLGRGLDVKDTVVHGQAWHRQVFDSSWVSALAETGVVGLLLTALYALGALVGAARRFRSEPLWFILALAVVLRGIVENGLVESSTTFVLFFAIACLQWPRRPRHRSAHAG